MERRERGQERCRAGRTVTDARRLGHELEAIREAGYACTTGERLDGASSASAPIRDAAGTVIAGLSVSGPSFRVTPERLARFARLVREAAAEVSAALGHRALPRTPAAEGGRRAAL